MKNFVLIGAAGYVAPRHLRAIKDTGNQLLAALDKTDSVGIMDRYFPKADFFVEFERFDRHLERLKRNGTAIDYVTICTPNYLHDAHIRFGLRHGAHVICEKPLVLNPWNAEALLEIEKETHKSVNTILQLRLHPSVLALKKLVESAPEDKIFDVELTYITSRGNWYYTSWKGEAAKSGGIATNIGVHFFDMLQWVFGEIEEVEVHLHRHDRAAGFLRFKKANVRWFLSINADTLPSEIQAQGQTTFRALRLDQQPFEFSDGFTDLHTQSYAQILDGKGFRIQDAMQAIELVHDIRQMTPQVASSEKYQHPFVQLPLAKHPFER